MARTIRPPKSVNIDDGRIRCKWAASDPMLAAYHDHEWGAPITTDAGHLERMVLEIFQCGLSWKIVLVKRPALNTAFGGFDPKRVAALTARDVNRLCNDASIIRNRAKIEATIHNARRVVALAGEHRSYRRWFDGLPIQTARDLPAAVKLFRGEGFKFLGPETVKCYLMGCGKIAPEHEKACFQAK